MVCDSRHEATCLELRHWSVVGGSAFTNQAQLPLGRVGASIYHHMSYIPLCTFIYVHILSYPHRLLYAIMCLHRLTDIQQCFEVCSPPHSGLNPRPRFWEWSVPKVRVICRQSESDLSSMRVICRQNESDLSLHLYAFLSNKTHRKQSESDL